MTDHQYPCIVYRRFRECEPRANRFAQIQQTEAEGELPSLGYSIIGAHSDLEFTRRFCGYLEPRPGWQNAVDAAIDYASIHGQCALIVLRSDGIGSGDPFMPNDSEPLRALGVNIRLCGFSLRGHATTTSLKDGLARVHRFIEADMASQAGQLVSISNHEPDRRILVRVDPWKALARLYFPNPGTTPLRFRLCSTQRPAGSSAAWPQAGEWRELEIPPQSAAYLGTFVQGDPEPALVWFRIKIGEGRETEVGNIVIQPGDLEASSLPICWYRYTPAARTEADYLWEDAPFIQTDRLILRNWTQDDCSKISAMLAEDALTGSGCRCDVDRIEFDDLEIFADIGRSGPTLWVLEHKATRAAIGICGLLCDDDASEGGRWQLGCIVLSHMQAQGFALEAASAAIATAFNDWNAVAVAMTFTATCAPACRLAERLGMECEDPYAVLIENSSGCGHITFKIDRKQFWRTGRTPATLDVLPPQVN